jgi:hypothetical protein
MKAVQRIRFSLRSLLVIVLLICSWLGLVTHQDREMKQHKATVLCVVRHGGCVEYQSGRSGANPYHLFPEETWLRKFFPQWKRDRVISVTFQRADQSFGTTIRGTKGIAWIDPDWSLESMRELGGSLQSFPDLRRLSFDQTPLPRHGLRCIEGLTRLESLDLSETRITSADVVHLRGLVNLEYLNLKRTRIDNDCLTYIQGMRKLKVLLLGSTRIGDDGMTHLTQIPSLEVLSLSNTPLTDEGLVQLAACKHLRELRIDHTAVTDAGLHRLQAMQNLRLLALGSRNTPREAVESIRRTLPHCQIEMSSNTLPTLPTSP